MSQPHAHAITVRPFKPEDLDAIVGIVSRAIRETASAHYNPDEIAAWAKSIAMFGRSDKRAGLHGLPTLQGKQSASQTLKTTGTGT